MHPGGRLGWLCILSYAVLCILSYAVLALFTTQNALAFMLQDSRRTQPALQDSLRTQPAHQDSLPVRVQDSTVYLKAAAMRTTADSLRNIWRVQWKRSDSLRVASMLYRMRSDSIMRLANSLITIFKNDSVRTADSVRESSLRRMYDMALKNLQRKNASALTAADSLTAAVMVTEPDTGRASFYANAFHGKKTSSGEVYNMNDKTCAHRWLPFGTLLRVQNLNNGKETIVRVNDRGPFKHGRVIDLSKQAAVEIDMIRAGTALVELSVVTSPQQPRLDPINTPPGEDP